jgi:hypothetical protein
MVLKAEHGNATLLSLLDNSQTILFFVYM